MNNLCIIIHIFKINTKNTCLKKQGEGVYGKGKVHFLKLCGESLPLLCEKIELLEDCSLNVSTEFAFTQSFYSVFKRLKSWYKCKLKLNHNSTEHLLTSTLYSATIIQQ